MKYTKINGIEFCKELCKRLWKKSNAWNRRHLVNESFVPSTQWTSVYWRLLDFNCSFYCAWHVLLCFFNEFLWLLLFFISWNKVTVLVLHISPPIQAFSNNFTWIYAKSSVLFSSKEFHVILLFQSFSVILIMVWVLFVPLLIFIGRL